MEDLLYLEHATTLKNLKKIINSGQLYSPVDMYLKDITSKGGYTTGNWTPSSLPDQYPGVYMKLIHKKLIDVDNPMYSSEYHARVIVVGVVLLKDP